MKKYFEELKLGQSGSCTTVPKHLDQAADGAVNVTRRPVTPVTRPVHVSLSPETDNV